MSERGTSNTAGGDGSFPPSLALARLFAEAGLELGRLARLRGASRRTWRRQARLAALVIAVAGIATGPGLVAEARASTPGFIPPFPIPNNGIRDAVPELADIDGDGDLDAFVGEFYGNTIFFENTGTLSSPAFAAPQTNPFGLADVGFLSAPALADIDGDGDLDAFVGVNDGNIVFFENTGTPTSPAFAAPQTNPFGLADVGWFSSPALADIDGDGDLDVLVGETFGSTVFFENTGSSISPAFAAPQTNPFGLADVGDDSALALADIDGDGDLDAFVGARDGNTIFFENTGSATSPAFAAPQTDPFGLADVGHNSTPALADIDGDGDLDAFVGESFGYTVFFENTGSSTSPAFAPTSPNPFALADVGDFSSPALADIDGDGDLDAFVGEIRGNTIFFENTGSSISPAFAAPQTNPFGLADVGLRSSPALADIDGDGDLDAFIGEWYGRTIFFENTGSSTAPAFAPPRTNPFGIADVGDFAAPAFADIDGDGDLDALVGERYGRTIFFENTGTSTAPAFAVPRTNPFGLGDVGYISDPTFADIDGDGDLDALVGEQDGNTIFFGNTGAATSPAFAAPQTNPFGLVDVGSRSSPELADIDGDGDLDVFLGNSYGTTFFLPNEPEKCGNGSVETGEQCDDGNATVGDGCDTSCLVEPGFQCTGSPSVCAEICGDGLVVGRETCDDGNTTPGDGCDASCQLECPPAPLSGCDQPRRAVLLIRDDDNDAKDRFQLRLLRNTPPRDRSELGDPTTGAIYMACVWDGSTLVAQLRAPVASLNWKISSRSYRYRDKTLAHDGLELVKVVAAPAGKPRETRAIVVGKGADLPDPVLPLSTPVNVTAQVIDTETGICFGQTFDDSHVRKNAPNAAGTVRTFKAVKRP